MVRYGNGTAGGAATNANSFFLWRLDLSDIRLLPTRGNAPIGNAPSLPGRYSLVGIDPVNSDELTASAGSASSPRPAC